MARIAVIGATGQVGKEFCECLAPDALVPLGHDDVDVTDERAVHECLGELAVDAIVNLSAYHDVNGCEADPARSFAVNAVGAGNVARMARHRDCPVVFVSSDYVFGLDSDRRTPYTESDAVAPINVYGASKVAGEHLVRAATPNHLIIRTSSVFGVHTSRKGWTFPEMILQRARAGETLKVVTDQMMAPTYAPDLVGTILTLLGAGATGTFHAANGGECTWFEFATTTLAMAGVDYPVEPVSSEQFPSPARRPGYSTLVSERFQSVGVVPLRSWQEGLNAYLTRKGLTA